MAFFDRITEVTELGFDRIYRMGGCWFIAPCFLLSIDRAVFWKFGGLFLWFASKSSKF